MDILIPFKECFTELIIPLSKIMSTRYTVGMKKLLASTILAAAALTGIAAHAALPYTLATQTGNTPASYLDTNFTAVSNMGVTQCTASGTNTVSLTPLANQGTVAAYQNYQEFLFVGQNTSTGAMSASVNSLASLPLYLADGVTQAGAGAVNQSAINVISYNSALNSGGGGFQLISQFPVAFTGTTGTGNVVLSNSPTLTGTITAAAATLSGTLTMNGQIFISSGSLFTGDAGKTILYNQSDSTKQGRFDLSGLTPGTTRTLTWPDASDTIAGISATQTLTNKTLTSPTINTPTIAGGSINNAIIGGITPVAGTFTTLKSSLYIPTGSSPPNSEGLFLPSSNTLGLAGHLASDPGGTSTPNNPTSCGTGSPTVNGDDTRGTITTGTSATSCTLTFGTTWGGAPYCVVSSGSTASNAAVTSTSTTNLVIALSASISADTITYICMQ